MNETNFLKAQASSIRAERARVGITQERLSELSGCSVSSIRKWEDDERGSVMSFESAVKISDALECSLEDLARRVS